MAGPTEIMGKGEGKAPLPQRGGGQDPFRRSATAGAESSAPEGPEPPSMRQTTPSASSPKWRSSQVAVVLAVIVAIIQIPDEAGEHPAADHRSSPAPSVAGPCPHHGGAFVRPELVDRGPALVSPSPSRHRDLPGALRLVRRAGTTGHPLVHPNPACSRTATTSNGSVSCQARKPSIPTQRPCAASAIRTRPTPRPSRRRRPSRA